MVWECFLRHINDDILISTRRSTNKHVSFMRSPAIWHRLLYFPYYVPVPCSLVLFMLLTRFGIGIIACMYLTVWPSLSAGVCPLVPLPLLTTPQYYSSVTFSLFFVHLDPSFAVTPCNASPSLSLSPGPAHRRPTSARSIRTSSRADEGRSQRTQTWPAL